MNQNIPTTYKYKINSVPDRTYIYLKMIMFFGITIYFINLFLLENFDYMIIFIILTIISGGIYTIQQEIKSLFYGGFYITDDFIYTFSGRKINLKNLYYRREALGNESILALLFYEKNDNGKFKYLLKFRDIDIGEQEMIHFIKVLATISHRDEREFEFSSANKGGVLHLNSLIK
jgi:hypothetical protein